MRSAVSCASPSASIRFLPTSSASAAPSRYTRSSISATARRSRRTRSCHGVAAQAGNAACAAATAARAWTSSPAWKRPSTTRVSIGERTGNCRGARSSRPPISIACSAPSWPRSTPTAASKRSCSAAGGSNIVE